MTAPLAAIVSCAGPTLTADERALFADADPAGFILFRRNCATPEQLRDLVASLRAAVGRDDAPVLIDQEGGRVVRLPEEHWRIPPAAARFGAAARKAPERATRAAWLNGRLIAAELCGLGITVNTLPVLDCPAPQADPVIGDRAFAAESELVSALGRATAGGLEAGGVTPVMKHVPGHGRARVDSHHALPRIEAPMADLRASDLVPFRALNDLAWAMTAHAVFDAIDPHAPVTTSGRGIREIVRGEIGFDGLLVSDDLGMAALRGDLAARAADALAAGCDLVLHCSGTLDETRRVLSGCTLASAQTEARLAVAERRRHAGRDTAAFDAAAARDEVNAVLETA